MSDLESMSANELRDICRSQSDAIFRLNTRLRLGAESPSQLALWSCLDWMRGSNSPNIVTGEAAAAEVREMTRRIDEQYRELAVLRKAVAAFNVLADIAKHYPQAAHDQNDAARTP